ncbi:hypothetical protein GCM10027294_43460 [Marinactinospora endophytica]
MTALDTVATVTPYLLVAAVAAAGGWAARSVRADSRVVELRRLVRHLAVLVADHAPDRVVDRIERDLRAQRLLPDTDSSTAKHRKNGRTPR